MTPLITPFDQIASPETAAMYDREAVPIITRAKNNRVTISHFPDRLAMTAELLRSKQRPAGTLRRRFRTVEFRFANGTARYRIRHRLRWNTFGLEKVTESS